MIRLPIAICLLSGLIGASAGLTVTAASDTRVGSTVDVVEQARSALRERQFTTALERLRAPAASGNANAQYLLGLMQLNGVGTAIDVSTARTWLQRAAEQHHSAAAFVLASLLSNSTEGDSKAATDWLQRSADLGYQRAIVALRDRRPLLAPERDATSSTELGVELMLYAARHNDTTLLGSLDDKFLNARDNFDRSALGTACAANATAAARMLIERGADTGSADRFGTTSAMLAATAADESLLDLLLARDVRLTETDHERRTALFYAARSNRAKAVAKLVAAGSPLEAMDIRGYTALDVAIIAEADAATAELRRLGARQSVSKAPSSKGTGKFDASRPGVIYRAWPAVALAVARGDAAEVARLLTATGTANIRTPQGDTLLHVALHANVPTMLPLLLKQGADPAQADRRGRTVLTMSAESGNDSALLALLSAGVNADTHAVREETPLRTAVRAGNLGNANLLLRAGAHIDAAGNDGVTALLLAAQSGNARLVALLLANKADVTLRNRTRQSALWRAAQSGSAETVQLLVNAGAEIDAADREGRTPLMAAASAGHLKVTEQLLHDNARTDLITRDGDTPLLLAAAADRVDIVQLLVRQSARPDTQNRYGDTALIAASRIGNASICRALLQAGANRSLRNKARATAADVARGRGFAELAEEIDQRG